MAITAQCLGLVCPEGLERGTYSNDGLRRGVPAHVSRTKGDRTARILRDWAQIKSHKYSNGDSRLD